MTKMPKVAVCQHNGSLINFIITLGILAHFRHFLWVLVNWKPVVSTLIPTKAYKKIAYIKKKEKVVNENKNKEVEELAKKYQLSEREILEYLELMDKLNKEL